MDNTRGKIIYKMFGLNIYSSILFPELLQTRDYVDQVDVIIEKADLSKQWNKQANQNKNIFTKENFVMFQVPNTAILAIEKGRRIIVSPMAGSDEDKIRLYILGTCMGVLLMQRKVLPLHGSIVGINGMAYAFVGERGAGKSTLAAAFINKGYQLLSDDVIAVSFEDENVPHVFPSYPQQKLWRDCLDHFDMEASHYRPLFERETKFGVPVHDRFLDEPLPLAGVFELVKFADGGEKVELLPIGKLERLQTLFKHTYRNFFIQRLGLMDWHFQFLTRIANKIEVAQLRRSEREFTVNDLVSVVLDQINKEKFTV